MAKMDDATRERIRNIDKKKRGRILKDVDPTDAQITVDVLQDERNLTPQPMRAVPFCVAYLRYVRQDVVDRLAELVPSCSVWLGTPSGWVVKTCFDRVWLKAWLAELVDDVGKYYRIVTGIMVVTGNGPSVPPVGALVGHLEPK